MPEPNPPEKLQVFLCHASGDKPQVRELYRRLKAENWVYPWLDEEELLPGQDWREEIEVAVEKSHIIVVCLSPASITKEGFVQREIKVALDQYDYMPEGTIYIVPLKLEECTPPRRLRRLHWVNYFEEPGHERLMRALRNRAEKLGIDLDSAQPAPPVITAAPPNEPQAIQEKVSPPVAPPPEQNPSVPERVALLITPVSSYSPPPALPKASETGQERLLRELENPNTNHLRRMEIGDLLSKVGDPRRGVGVRDDGIPDIVWLPVVPGGSLKIETETYQIEPFYIAKYLITCTQYRAFVDAEDGYDNPEWWQGMPEMYQKQKLRPPDPNLPSNPRNYVSWYQSVAFTRWLNQRLQGWQLPNPGNPSGSPFIVGQNAGVRLPTEWEWQWAAQGGKAQREYSWGDWQEGYANTYEVGLRRAIAVGMYPQGAAACGSLDMSGNLWEWCLNKYSKSEERRVLRGGSFFSFQDGAASTCRNGDDPDDDGDFGLRLVVSSPITPSDL